MHFRRLEALKFGLQLLKIESENFLKVLFSSIYALFTSSLLVEVSLRQFVLKQNFRSGDEAALEVCGCLCLKDAHSIVQKKIEIIGAKLTKTLVSSVVEEDGIHSATIYCQSECQKTGPAVFLLQKHNIKFLSLSRFRHIFRPLTLLNVTLRRMKVSFFSKTTLHHIF